MKNVKLHMCLVALLAALLCSFAPWQHMMADDSPLPQDSTLQEPPDIVFPLVRRWRISSLFDHTNPGDHGHEDQQIAVWTGSLVSDDPDPNDQNCLYDDDVCGYTDYDIGLKDLRWNDFAPGWLWYDRHYGYDYACPFDTPVVAATSGTAYLDGAFAVRVVHSSGYRTFYRHLNQRLPQSGSVQPGQWIGTSGDEGGLYDPHLHFEMRDANSRVIDPWGWQGGYTDPWSYNVGNVWASGDPIPMGYRYQNGDERGPYALDYSAMRDKWFELDGEPGSPLGDDVPGTLALSSGDTLVSDRMQPFEHGEIHFIQGPNITYYSPYAETYLPDIHAYESTNGWNSTIIVRNDREDGPATVSISLYTQDGRVLDSRTYKDLPAQATWALSVSEALIDFLSQAEYDGEFQGSAIVYANHDVSVAVRTLNNSQSLAYSGMPQLSVLGFQVGAQLYFPAYLNGFYNWNSEIHIANAGSGPTNVQVRYYSNAGTQTGSQNIDLAAHASTVLAPNSSATIGGVRIKSSEPNRPLAASITPYHSSLGRRDAHAAVSVGAKELYLPSVFRTYYGWECSINLFNTETYATSRCTITFYGRDGQAVGSLDCPLLKYGSQTFALSQLPVPPGWAGGVVVSADRNLVAAVFQEHSGKNDWQAYRGFKSGAPSLYVPWVQSSEGWTSSLTVMNAGCDSTNATVSFYDGSGSYVGSLNRPLSRYGSFEFYTGIPTLARSAFVSTDPPCSVVASLNAITASISDGGVSYSALDQ